MTHMKTTMRALLLGAGLLSAAAWAALPAPTPAAQQAAAAKKAQADAQAAKDKESLTASMDAVSSHWRSRAAQQGWKAHPPVAIAAAAPAGAAGAGGSAAAGVNAPIKGAAPAGQPAGQLTQAGANPLIKSEKFGTAPASEDVKKGPTLAQPKGAKPTVQKGSPDASKK